MNGSLITSLLREKYKCKNNSELSKIIKVNLATLGSWEKKEISKTIIKNLLNSIIKIERNKFYGEDFINWTKKQYEITSDSQIAEIFGISQPAVSNWRKNNITFRSIKEILDKSKVSHTQNIITPIIEFFPINRMESKNKVNFQILDQTLDTQGSLKDQLDSSHGIYLFYDSKGKAIYTGKAKKQTLWKEINLAFNRNRGASQLIKKVLHLKINRFDPSKENKRQIKSVNVFLHDIAVYFSAYRVDKELIDNLEAVIIRMFPNDLWNSKIERFKKLK